MCAQKKRIVGLSNDNGVYMNNTFEIKFNLKDSSVSLTSFDNNPGRMLILRTKREQDLFDFFF